MVKVMSRFEEYLESVKTDQVEYLMSYINIELDHEVLDKELRQKLKTNIEKILNKHL